MTKIRNRVVYLDALKVFALLLVFALHTQRGGEVTTPCHNMVFFYAARCSMPLFFMVNGALIMRKEEFSFAYYKKKVMGIIRILCIWGAVTVLYRLLVTRLDVLSSLKEGLKAALAYTDVVNLWFFYTFIIIYTILIWCFDFVKKNIWKVTLALGFICIVIDVFSITSVFHGGFFVQEAVTQRLRLWTWFFYFFLGYALSTMKTEKCKRWLIIAGAILTTILSVLWQYYICWEMTKQIESNYVYDNLIIILWCSLVFLTFRMSPGISSFFARFVNPSFGAFLLHSYFIDAFNLRNVVHGPFQAFLSWAALCICCWGLSWILGKIPVVREAFRY